MRRPQNAIVLVSLVVTATAMGTMSCSDLTSVYATDIVQPENLASPAGAEALRVGAVGSFFQGYGGTGPTGTTTGQGFVWNTGLISDEFFAGSPVSIASDPDFRTWTEPAGGPYTPLQKTRVAALEALRALQKHAPTPASRVGQMFALVGLTEVFLGEAVCSGISLGALTDAGPQFGTPLTTSAIFARAVADFDSALVYSADSARILNLARVGRGRALLNNGMYAQAAAAVASVPTNYVFSAEYSSSLSTQLNALYQFSVASTKLVSVSDREGVNGLDFRSANDPRVPWAFVSKGADGVSDIYAFSKMTSLASPIVVASGIEARLIEAEARLQAADAAGALAALNSLRATTISPALAPLTLQANATAQVNQLFRERAFWLFGTGHRHGDLRRLVRQYGRSAESVFPTGQARPGIFYGPRVVFVPDATAVNNPEYKGCASLDS